MKIFLNTISAFAFALCLILPNLTYALTVSGSSYTVTFNDHSGSHHFRVPADSLPNYTPDTYTVGSSSFHFLGWNKRIVKNTNDTYTAIYIEINDAPKPYDNTLGIINGAFSISDTSKIFFSKGNLQYQPSSGTWRFALSQNNYVGNANSNISDSTYSGWLDLFGYATSGWNNGSAAFQPNSFNTSSGDYFSGDIVGAYAEADWGVHNAISNGGNQPGLWRTLNNNEWSYLVFNRPNANLLHAEAYVNDTLGMVLCPDEFPAGAIATGMSIPADAWSFIEQYGTVFLPYAGTRKSDRYYYHNSGGDFRSAYHASDRCYMTFNWAYSPSDNSVGPFLYAIGHSVRLVRPTYQVTFIDPNGDILDVKYLANQTKPEAPDVSHLSFSDSCMTVSFAGWSPNITLVSGNTTYIAQLDTVYNNFQITYNINNVPQAISVPCGTTPNLPTPAKWQNNNYEYSFNSWSPAPHPASANETYTAIFDSVPLTYAITWLNYDNSVLSTDSVHRGITPTYHGTTPTRQGNSNIVYTFSGWTPSIVPAIADASYTATYDSIKSYVITTAINRLICPGESITLPSGKTVTVRNDMTISDTLHFSPLPDLVCDSVFNISITVFRTPSASFYEPVIVRGKTIDCLPATEAIINSVSTDADDMEITSYWWEIKRNGVFTKYNNRTSYSDNTLTMRFVMQTNCGNTIYLPNANGANITTLAQNPDNTPECDNSVIISLIASNRISLNVTKMRAMGYMFNENDIHWYRVVGNVDDIDECPFPALCDDVHVGVGSTLKVSPSTTGAVYYYCLINAYRTSAVTAPCHGIMRSNTYRFDALRIRKPEYTATPTEIVNSGTVTITGLDPETDYTLSVYDMAGRLISTYTSTDSPFFEFEASGPAGCYRIVITSAEGTQSLAYIISSAQ